MTQILLVAGVIVAVVRIRRRESQFGLLLFFVPLLSISLTESPPLSPRLLLTYPGIIVLATSAAAAIADAIGRAIRARAAPAAALAALAVVPVVFGPITYFARHDANATAYWPWIEPQSSVGRFAQSFDGETWLVTDAGGLYASEAHFTFYDLGESRVQNYGRGLEPVTGSVAFVFVPANVALLEEVREKYPGGSVQELLGRTAAGQVEDTVIAIIYVSEVR